MSIDTKVKMIMASAGVNGRELAPAFGCTPQSATTKINRGLKTISDLVKLCEYCGAKVQLVSKDGSILPLTLEDIAKEVASNEQE